MVALALCFGVGINAAFAGTAGVSGTLDASDPTLPVVSITPPNCVSQLVTPVHYEAHVFQVDVSGVYTLDLTSPGNFASLYLYAGSFDPANPLVNCVAADNSAPKSVSFPLTAGATYIVVPFDDQFVQAGGTYNLTANGPGNITFGGGGKVDICINPMPSNAVVHNVPGGAPAYFKPYLQSYANFNLPAGTWKISEFSGDFAKVWIACQANSIWIPISTLAGVVG